MGGLVVVISWNKRCAMLSVGDGKLAVRGSGESRRRNSCNHYGTRECGEQQQSWADSGG